MLAKLKQHDWLITIILAILTLLSLLLIFATTYSADNPQEGQGAVLRQIVFFVVGFSVYFMLSLIDIHWLKQRTVILLVLAFTIITLIYVLVFAEARANTLRWIILGPFSFQPAEFAKIGVVLITAFILSWKNDALKMEQSKQIQLKKYILSILLVVVTALLVFAQKSLGNSLILIIIWASVIFCYVPMSLRTTISLGLGALILLAYYRVGIFADIANYSFLGDLAWKAFIFVAIAIIFFLLIRLFNYSKLLLIGIFLVCLGFAPATEFIYNNVLAGYQRQRIETFVSAGDSAENQSFQVRQSIIAVGSGQIFGRGFLQGRQSTLQVLPFAHTDFIFAALAEQFGFVGIIILFMLYGGLIWRILAVAFASSDQFAKLVCFGCASIIIINSFINVGMNIGILPVTGVPLPLLSHGGSSVIVIMLALGLVQSMRSSLKATNNAEKFEFISGIRDN